MQHEIEEHIERTRDDVITVLKAKMKQTPPPGLQILLYTIT